MNASLVKCKVTCTLKCCISGHLGDTSQISGWLLISYLVMIWGVVVESPTLSSLFSRESAWYSLLLLSLHTASVLSFSKWINKSFRKWNVLYLSWNSCLIITWVAVFFFFFYQKKIKHLFLKEKYCDNSKYKI